MSDLISLVTGMWVDKKMEGEVGKFNFCLSSIR